MTPLVQIRGKRSAWLLDLDLQGRVFRFTNAEKPRSVTGNDGTFLYSTGMAGITRTFTIGEPNDQGITLNATQSETWALLFARGHRFEIATATLRLHYEDQTIEQAQVALRGEVVGAVYGDSFEPLTFTIRRNFRTAGEIPFPSMRIDDQTWPVRTNTAWQIDPEIYGSDYPIIIGQPGNFAVFTPGFATPTTPAYLVEFERGVLNISTSRMLIAGHEVSATNVTLVDVTEDTKVARPVKETKDELGRTISYVDFQDLSIIHNVPRPVLGNEYRLIWDQGDGGVQRRDGTGAIRGLGETIRYLLETWTTIDLDVGRQEGQRVILDAFLVDFNILRRTGVWGFIQKNFVGLFPIEWRESDQGGFFQAIKFDVSAHDAVGVLDATPRTGNVERVGRVQSAGTPIFNRITLKYGKGGPQSRYLKSVTIDAADIVTETLGDGTGSIPDNRTIPSYRCQISQSLFGIRPQEFSTDVVYDDATAQLLAVSLAERHALPRRVITVEGGPELERYDVNDVATLTASDINITDEVVLIRDIVVAGDKVALRLLLLDDPAKLLRVTS